MSIDSYAACPGGTGKKIKFCCGDLVGELEQLDRLIEADQIAAALEQARRLDEKHPGRACLLATRTKLELGSKNLAEAAATSRRFLDAFPDNPLALGESALTEALAGRVQEAAALFDKARERAASVGEGGAAPHGVGDPAAELARIAATIVQVAAQAGHIGFAQGIVDWMVDRGLGSAEELRMLAAVVGSAGVPVALRTKVPLIELTGDSPWRFEFDRGVAHARQWRLEKALTTLRSLKGVAGDSLELFTNIAVVSEMLARPMEASEAWRTVARTAGVSADEAVEATGRAIALETEATPDRSPQVRYTSVAAALAVPPGEEGVTALELLEDTLRHSTVCETAAFDRSAWVAREAVPPRSVWRVYEDRPAEGPPPRLLASLLVFGRQTDRDPQAVLQGFTPDVATARPICERLLAAEFAPAADVPGMPAVTPTQWLLSSQFRMPPPTPPAVPPQPGEPAVIDRLLAEQMAAVRERFVAVWPDEPLPELLGRTPREAVKDAEGRRRVEALVVEGEATSRSRAIAAAWTALREPLGLPRPADITNERPLEEVPPLRWHRLEMSGLPVDELRGLLVTATEAGFDAAAERAAEAIIARSDALPQDRLEAFGVLESRAESTSGRLELLGRMKDLVRELRGNVGMLELAELRIRLQRGDQSEILQLLERLQRNHARDPRVMQGLAEVLMEAGVDLSAVAGRAAGGGAAAAGVPTTGGLGPAATAEPGKLWTPGGESAAGGGEKKTIWTPG
jgi:tetratricopeptide (TPR) repeat protein